MELNIVGWRLGLRTVSFIRLLNSDFDMSMSEAKAAVDLVLSRSDFTRVSSEEGTATVVMHLVDPVPIEVPEGAAVSEAKSKLEELGLVLGSS